LKKGISYTIELLVVPKFYKHQESNPSFPPFFKREEFPSFKKMG
jgi:hypothetical protein